MSQAVQSPFQTALNRHGADTDAASGLPETLPFQNHVGDGLSVGSVQFGKGGQHRSAAFQGFGPCADWLDRLDMLQVIAH